MLALVARRVAQAGVVAVLVATLAFFLIHLAPGDPFAELGEQVGADLRAEQRARFGLDDPVGVQYLRYVRNVARGDLGLSFETARPVRALIAEALPRTLLLMGTALTLSFALGVLLGVVQAVRRGGLADRLSRAVTLVCYSMPDFWLALLLLLLFSQRLRWLPTGGMPGALARELYGTGGYLLEVARHLVLPVLALVLLSTAVVARLQRSALLATLPEDYVRTAVAKGLSRRRAVLRHALRNALLPVITLVGLAFPALLGGAVLIERVFNWPGMGLLVVNAIGQRDYFVLVGCVLVGSVMVVLGGLLADVLTALADPRQREA